MKKYYLKSHHLVIILAVAMTIITGLLLLRLNNSTENEIVGRFNAEQIQKVKNLSREIKTYLTNRVQLIDVLSSLSAFQNKDTKYIKSEIDKFLAFERRNYVRTISIYNESGTIIYSSNNEIIGHKLKESEIFKWAKKPENKGKQYISSPIKFKRLQTDSLPHIHIVIASPIYKLNKNNGDIDTSYKFVGVVTENLEIDKLFYELITANHFNSEKEHFWVMDKSGTLYFHADHPEMVNADVKQQNEACFNCHISFRHIDKMLVNKEGNLEFQLKNAPQQLAGYTTLEINNISWLLVLDIPSEEVTQFVLKNLLQSYFLLGMIVLTFFIISYLIYRSYRLRVRAEAENEQLKEKSELKEKASESEKRYKSLFNDSQASMLLIDPENGKIIDANPSACKYYGWSFEQITNMKISDINTLAEEEVLREMKRSVDGKNNYFIFKHRLSNGEVRDVEVYSGGTQIKGKNFLSSIVHDITQRRLVEEELRDSEERYRTFINSTEDLVSLKDENYKYILVNESNKRFFGKTDNEILGKTEFDLMPRENALTCMRSNVDAIEQNKIVISIEEQGGRQYETHKFPVHLKNGKTGVGEIIRDVTETKKAEEALKNNELKYRLLFNNNPLPMWVYDLETLRFLNVNKVAVTNYGYSKEEFLSMTLKDIRPAEDLAKLMKNIPESKLEMRRSGPWRHKLKDGTIIFVEIHSHSIEYENKQARLVLAQDITDSLKADDDLRNSESKYRGLSENALSGIYATTLEGDFKYANKALCDMLEFDSPEDLISQNILNYYKNPQDRDRLIQQLNEFGHVINYEFDIFTKSGKCKSLIISGYLEKRIISGMMLDITERKQGEKELLAAKERAESANKLKDAFIANISHEIRTPLNGLLGMTNIVRDIFPGKINKENEELFDGINISSNRLIRTVDLILNYSRLQVGEFQISKKEIAICPIINDLVKEFIKPAKCKSIEFNYENRCKNAVIFMDEFSLTIVISNIIDNAIKFTSQGFINLSLYKDINGEIIFEVKDTGIGISEEYLEKIFEPYRQEIMGYGRPYDGVGLGLALVKKVLSLNNAEITVTSKKGEGSIFRVNLGTDRIKL